MSILDSVQVIPANSGNYGAGRAAGQIKYLVYHYTANDGDTAVGNGNYFKNNVVQASAHYFVDDNNIVQSVDPLKVAWAVGGTKWSDCATTGGGTMYGLITNTNSISIEMCDTVKDGTIMATEKTLSLAAELGKAIMKEYDSPVSNVYRHFDVTGKHCPAYFMDNDKWEAFKERLTNKEDEQMKIYNWFEDMPDWARESAEKAYRKGIIKADETTKAVSVYEVNLQPLVWLDRLGLLD